MPSIRLISRSIKLKKQVLSILTISLATHTWLKFFSNCWISCSKTNKWTLTSTTMREEVQVAQEDTVREVQDNTKVDQEGTAKEVQVDKWTNQDLEVWCQMDSQCQTWLVVCQDLEPQWEHQCLNQPVVWCLHSQEPQWVLQCLNQVPKEHHRTQWPLSTNKLPWRSPPKSPRRTHTSRRELVKPSSHSSRTSSETKECQRSPVCSSSSQSSRSSNTCSPTTTLSWRSRKPMTSSLNLSSKPSDLIESLWNRLQLIKIYQKLLCIKYIRRWSKKIFLFKFIFPPILITYSHPFQFQFQN